MAFASPSHHCSKFLRLAAMMSAKLARLSLKTQPFLSHQSSHVVAMINIFTLFLHSLFMREIAALTVEVVLSCSSLGIAKAEHPFHLATSVQSARERWQFQNSWTEVSKFLKQKWQKYALGHPRR